MRRVAAALLVGGLALSACSTPEGDPQAYRQEARSTLRAARSSVESVRIAVGLRLADRSFGRATDDAVTSADEALSGTAATFSGLQPPRGADAVHDRATSLLTAAQDAVEEARVAVRRDDRQGLRSAVDDVAASSRALDDAQEALS